MQIFDLNRGDKNTQGTFLWRFLNDQKNVQVVRVSSQISRRKISSSPCIEGFYKSIGNKVQSAQQTYDDYVVHTYINKHKDP